MLIFVSQHTSEDFYVHQQITHYNDVTLSLLTNTDQNCLLRTVGVAVGNRNQHLRITSRERYSLSEITMKAITL